MKNLVSILVVFVLVSACKKAEDRSCWKFWGDEKTMEIAIDADFDKLFLNAHLEYELVQDSTDKLVIIGGENVIKKVEWSISDDKTLTISNKNKCHFLRNERKVIKVEIHYTNIYNIHFEGTEPLKTRGTLNTNYFVLFIRDGAGPVTMDLNCISVVADISHGWGNYVLTGNTDHAFIGARSNGYGDALGLNVNQSIYVSHETSGTLKVNCGNLPLDGYLKGNGNILYKGTPSSMNILDTGGGEVLKID